MSNQPGMSASAFRQRLKQVSPGFTLVEVLIASAIASLIATALAHILSVAFDLSDTSSHDDKLAQETRLAISLMEADIREAKSISVLSLNLTTLIRQDDSKVQYHWNGTADTPLYRTTQSHSNKILCGSVRSLEFTLVTIERSVLTETAVLDSTTKEVNSFQPGDWSAYSGSPNDCTSSGMQSVSVSQDQWYGERFVSLDTFDSLTKVWIYGYNGGSFPNDYLALEIYDLDGSDQPRNLLAYASYPPSTFTSSLQWHGEELTVVDKAGIRAAPAMMIVCRASNCGYAGRLVVEVVSGCREWPDNGMYFRYCNDKGNSWSGRSDVELIYSLDGLTYSTHPEEIKQTQIDTLGISYSLQINSSDNYMDHGGYFAFSEL